MWLVTKHMLISTTIFFLLIATIIAKNDTTSAKFVLYKALRNTFCSDHATGTSAAPSIIACGSRCMRTDGCKGYLYNRGSRVCTVVKIIAIPQSGCQPENGTNYFVKLVPDLFDGYAWTAADMAHLGTGAETQSSACTRHPYHVFHADVAASEVYGCAGFTCCKTKGCYPGTAQQYTGTWSRTVSGRKCQNWDQQSPHPQEYYKGRFPAGETYVDAVNYCRDPDYGNVTGYLWCYTVDPVVRWEECDVPRC